MVAVGSALRVLGGGLYFYGFSVFFLPLSQDLGLSRAATSLVFSLARAQGAFEGPVAGYFMDRYGPRPLILSAIVMSGVGHMLLSEVQSYFALLVIYLGVVSLSFQAGFMDAPMVIANTWFIRMRTMAMSMISASVNLGGFLLTPLLAWAIQIWGWRSAAFGAGIIFLLAGLPLALLVRRSPESMGLQPDGDPPFHPTQTERQGQPQNATQETHFTLAEAMRTSPFWYLTIGTCAANRCPYGGGRALRSDHGVEGNESNGGGISFGRPVISRHPGGAFAWLAGGPGEQGQAYGRLHARLYPIDDGAYFRTRTLANLVFPAVVYGGGGDVSDKLVLCRRILRAHQLRQDPRHDGFRSGLGRRHRPRHCRRDLRPHPKLCLPLVGSGWSPAARKLALRPRGQTRTCAPPGNCSRLVFSGGLPARLTTIRRKDTTQCRLRLSLGAKGCSRFNVPGSTFRLISDLEH